MKLTGYIIIVLLLIGLVGCASAATYTQSGSLAFPNTTNLSTINTYDSSQITSMNITLTPTVTHSDPNNISGCVGYYKFDDGSGTSVLNSVNSSANGTIGPVANTTLWSTGKYNGSLSFNVANTSDGRLTITNPVLGATACTFSCWVNANYTSYGSIFSDWNSPTYNIAIYQNSTDSLRFYVGNGTNYSYSLTNANWTNNQWHMVTCTYNASTNNMAVWIDLNKASSTAAGASGPIPNIGNTSASGNGACGFARYVSQFSSTKGFLNGSIDNAAFWNRSLTDVEIQSLYYSQLAGITIKSNANSTSGVVSTANTANIPYGSADEDITSINLTIPESVTVGGLTINDFTRTVPSATYTLSVMSNEAFLPAANFVTNISCAVAPKAIQFYDTSVNNPTSWHWDFGDGSTSTSQNPIHLYSTAGNYTVTLTATSSSGATSHSSYIPVYITLPTNITWSGQTWHVSTTGPGGNTWGTSNGSIWIDEQDRLHMTVKNVSGVWVSSELNNVNYTKYGVYTWNVASPLFQFDKHIVGAMYLYYNDTEEIDFESSYWSNISRPNGQFVNQPGWVGNINASWNKVFMNITDNGQPYEVKFIYHPTYVQYYLNRSGSNLASWNMTNASEMPTTAMKTSMNVWQYQHQVPSNGLTQEMVLNDFSYVDDLTPLADFSSSVSGSTLATQFIDTSLNTPTSWAWNFGDGTSNSTSQNPAHTYNASGTYVVTLTTANNEGSNTVAKTVIVAWSPITMRLNSIDVSTDSTAIELVSAQNNLYETVTSTISSGYILGSLIVLVLAGAGIMRFLGFL